MKTKLIATIMILFLAIVIEPMSFSQTQDQLVWAYVVNSYSGDVSVINTDTYTEIARIPIGVQGIFDVAVTPDGSRVYVSGGNGADSLFVIRAIDNTVIGEITGVSSPHGMDITRDGLYIYAASFETNEVAIVRVPDGMTETPVTVGDMPSDVAVTPTGEFVYVANSGDNTVSVIRTSDNTVVDTVSVGIQPLNLAMHPDGDFVYVACYGTREPPTLGGVYVIDTSSNAVVDVVTIYGYMTRGIEVTPNGEYVYVANRLYHEVNVIRTLDNVELMDERVTLSDDAEPRWIAMTPDGDYAYVTLHTTRKVAVISTADNAVRILDAGEGPVGIDIAQVAPEESAWGPTLELSATEACLGAVIHVTVTGIVPKYQIMIFEVVFPPELSYVDFSFKVNGIPTTPSLDPDGISYTAGWVWGWDYTIEFDFEVTTAYEEDVEVHPYVMGRFYDEFGNEIGSSGVIGLFTIYAADIFIVEVAGTPEGDFHITVPAGEEKGAPVTSWQVISMINIDPDSWSITLTQDRMVLDITGRLQDPNRDGQIVLEVDPDSEIITCAINIAPFGSMHIDIKPSSWPNPINVRSKGVFAVAICGTKNFNVETVDPSTVKLYIAGIAQGVSPIRWSYQDDATPYVESPGGGHALNGDGYIDIVFHFDTQTVVTKLGLAAHVGETVLLIIKGNLYPAASGLPIQGQDYVWILKNRSST